jgi:hypothetical protein
MQVERTKILVVACFLLSTAAFPILALPMSSSDNAHLEVRQGGSSAADFCGAAKFVSLDKILATPKDYLDKRVKTHAVLTTNVKEYTRISSAENSDFSVLTTLDDQSVAYTQSSRSSDPSFPTVVDDLFDKLRSLQGPKFPKDMSKVEYYRRDVMVCGRLTGSGSERRFAVDDMHTEDSYLLPWRGIHRERRSK